MKHFRQNFVQNPGSTTVLKAMTTNLLMPMISFHVWKSMMIHFRQIPTRYRGFRQIFLMAKLLEVNDDPFETNSDQIQRI